MLTETFGEMLFVPESDSLKECPSPEELKHRIIISTKPPKEYLEASASVCKDRRNNSTRSKESEDDVWGSEPSSLTADQEENEKVCWKWNSSPILLVWSNMQLLMIWIHFLQSDSDKNYEDDDESIHRPHVSSAYKRLIAIHAGKPKGGLKEALKIDPDKVRRLSLSEQALEKAAESHGTDIVRFVFQHIKARLLRWL